MLGLYESNWKLFRDYALTDAVITHLYAVRILRLYQELTGEFTFPLTLTSIGVDLLIKKWVDEKSNEDLKRFLSVGHEWDPLSLVGREAHRERYWDKKHNRFGERRSTPLIQKLFWNEYFFTDGYHGGRNEQFWFGPLPEGLWYDYDLTSAYPSVMTLIGYPQWEAIRSIKDVDDLLSLRHVDLAVANVNFEFPESVRFPCLPVRTEGGLLFPRSGNTTAHISEILVAHSLGAEIELVEGRVVPTIRYQGWGGYVMRPFLAFTQECVRKRREYPKGSLENAFWKEMVNSTYGKTAQGLKERRIYDLRDEETKDLGPSKITNPYYASMITGFCRATLGEIMNALPDDVLVCSVTTDGFLTTATPAQMDDATSTFIKGYPWEEEDCDYEQFPPNSCAGYYKEASKFLRGIKAPYLDSSKSIYEVKHVCRQPLGWRTRGQATLKPALQSDIEALGLKNDDELYVLAKAGMKVGDNLTKAAQNLAIVKIFIERNEDSVIEQSRLYGIKEMYESGYDLAQYKTSVSVSMEYDWKRKPTKAVDFPMGEYDCNHLQFQTAPWKSVVRYNEIRNRWRTYTKGNIKCLKTLSDLRAFNGYHSSQSSLETSGAGKYLPRSGDGDLKRLRMQIAMAQAGHRAGTETLKPHAFGDERIFPTYKLRAQQLSDFLNEVGVPCRKRDIENDRRKYKKIGFVPHQVPRNSNTERILLKLKEELFPTLKIDEFLTEPAEFELLDSGDKELDE